MFNTKTVKFINYLKKTAAETSSGLQQKKYKITKTYKNNAGPGTGLGAGIGAVAGFHVPPKYRALGIGLGGLAGAGIGRLIGKRSIDKKLTKSQEINLKREEKRNEGASIPRLSMSKTLK
jgi:hypothetical protein